jgi:hypothetical protein
VLDFDMVRGAMLGYYFFDGLIGVFGLATL